MANNCECQTNDCTEGEYAPIYKEEKKENITKNQFEINIPTNIINESVNKNKNKEKDINISIPIGKINLDYRIKILRKKYVNQKNHKKIKNKAFNQYKVLSFELLPQIFLVLLIYFLVNDQ